jgi:hypothetical protein
LSIASPQQTIAVGVVVERAKGATEWLDFVWRPVGVLAGEPETVPWTKLSDDGARATFYAGAAEIELYRSETGNYRDNLASGQPAVWVVLRATGGEPPYAIAAVTVDPAEGESFTEVGMGQDTIEAVPMPDTIVDAVAAFVAEHHVEHGFVKRQRDRADPQVLARRLPHDKGGAG